MQHEDSAGNKGELNPGDVQWMTAGRGIVHSEEPHEEFSENRWDDTWVPNLGESSFKTQNDVTKISGNPRPNHPLLKIKEFGHALLPENVWGLIHQSIP